MKHVFVIVCALTLAGVAHAAPPAGAPAGSTGVCNDGSYYDGAEKKGACRGHKGVKEFWGPAAPAAAAKSAAPTPAAAPAPAKAAAPAAPAAAPTKGPAPAAAAPAPAPTKAPAPSAAAPAKTAPTVAAAGGGAGKVWANASTKVYHCEGDRWYGKTKEGEYMSESAALAKGFKGSHGKTCK